MNSRMTRVFAWVGLGAVVCIPLIGALAGLPPLHVGVAGVISGGIMFASGYFSKEGNR